MGHLVFILPLCHVRGTKFALTIIGFNVCLSSSPLAILSLDGPQFRKIFLTGARLVHFWANFVALPPFAGRLTRDLPLRGIRCSHNHLYYTPAYIFTGLASGSRGLFFAI